MQPPYGNYGPPSPPPSPPTNRGSAAAAFVLLLLSAVGVGSRLYRTFVPPGAGASCSGSSARCQDARTWLTCVNDRLALRACHGPGGCSVDGTQVRCDEAVSSEGASCTGTDGACSEDGLTMLRCEQNTLHTAGRCLGPQHCTTPRVGNGTQVRCDGAVAEVGNTCAGEDAVCTTDHHAIVRCAGGHMALYSYCRGPLGCVEDAASHMLDCDGNVRQVGDPCHSEGSHGCSPDGAQFLQCTQGVVATQATCEAGTRCQVRGDRIGCFGDGTAAPAAENAGTTHVRNAPVRHHH